MKSKFYSTPAVVLSQKPYKESDLRITLYTRDFGKITLVAKSARLPKSRKRGSLSVGNYINIQVVEAKGFDIISEAYLLNSFSGVKSDLKKLSVNYFVLEVISRLTEESEENEGLFDLLVESLNQLNRESNLKSFRLAFVKKVLVNLGYWPTSQKLINADALLEQIAERKFATVRVGRRMLQ